MPKAKPYSGPVDEKTATPLLNSTGKHVVVDGEDLLLGDALLQTLRNLQEIIECANAELEHNGLAKIVAEHLAAKMSRRGDAEIAVTETGDVRLYISYDDQSARHPPPSKAKLPLLEELKIRADKMGVDISEFGIKRKRILEHLDGIENGEIKPKSKKAKARRKKMQVETAQEVPEVDPGPMSAGPDETRVSAPPDDPKPPKRRGIVKTSEGPVVVVDTEPTAPEVVSTKAPKPPKSQGSSGPGLNMRELVQESKEVSIADLLQSEPPKQ